VLQSSAQMDAAKLLNLNGQYMAALPFDAFLEGVRAAISRLPWAATADAVRLEAVARLMQSRTKLYTDVAAWEYFFVDSPSYDEKAVGKFLRKPGVSEALSALAAALEPADALVSPAAVEAAIAAVATAGGFEPGRLNQPIRVAVTGCTIGAGVYETLAVLGRETVRRRLIAAADLARGGAVGASA